MNRTLRLLFLLTGFLIGLSSAASAQRTIGLVAKAQADKIMLRWTPDSSVLWLQAIQDGYYVQRRAISRNGVALTGTTFATLNTGGTPLKPLPDGNPFWTAATADSSYRRSMRELLYAPNPTQPATDPVDGVKPPAASQLHFYRYVNALITADQSYATAIASGLGFIDETAQSNERYEYQIVTGSITSQPVTIGLINYAPLAPPDKPTVQFGTQVATLSWKADSVVTGYNTYWVERSTNGTTFSPRNKQALLVAGQDITSFFYQDSMPKGRRTYYYRLQGKTIFDEVGYSAVVFGQSKDTLVSAPRIKELQFRPNGDAYLTWQFPGDTLVARADTLLKGYFVGVATRSQDRPVPTKIDIAPTETSAVVTNYRTKAPGGSTYYFSVGAVRLDGDTLLSSPVFIEPLDSIPPTVPTGLQGVITAQGMGNLSWRPNPEADLLGYKVFRAQRAGEEPSAITADQIIPASSWQDPVALNFLNAGVYYQVKAIDRHYNESPLSAPLYLVKPDTIRPSAPAFQRFSVQSSGVRLRWAPSFSRDVVQHTLYRRDAAGGGWQALNVFAKRDTTINGQRAAVSDTAWTDAGAQASHSYTYLLLANDAGGLVSDSTARLLVDVPASLGNQKPYFSTLNAQANPDRQAVTLTWSYDAPDVAEYQLYRAAGNKPIGLWKMVAGLETSTDDQDVQANTTYVYKVRASFKDGTLSNWQSVSVTYQTSGSANQPPYVASAIPGQRAIVGSPFSYVIPANTFADDNAIQSVRILPNGLPPGIAANTTTFSGTPLRSGTYTVTVQALDNQGVAVSTTFSLSINGAPTLITGLEAKTVTVGQSFAYTVPTTAFFDGQGSVTLTIVSAGLPAGLTASGATLSGTLSAPGPFTISVQATNAAGASTTTWFKLTGNQPPRLVAGIPAQSATINQPTSWTLPNGTFTDPESQSLTTVLLANGLPAGLAAQGAGYTGIPTNAGSYSLTVRATDNAGAVTEARFTLTVSRAANVLPKVATTLPSQTLTIGKTTNFTVPSTLFFDEDGQITSVSLSGSVPPGLSVQGTRLSGTPTTAGTYPMTATATDDQGATVSTTLTFIVPAGVPAPTIAGSATICAGQTTVLTASNCGGTVQWSTGSTGSSLMVNPLTTTTYTATCQQDGQNSAVSNAVVVTVVTPVASIVGSTSVCSGQATSLTATGGSTYRWNTGATTATISVSAAGPYSVTATNQNGCSAVASTSVTTTNCPVSGTYVNCGGPQIVDAQGRTWLADDTDASPYRRTSTGIGTGSIVAGGNQTDAPDALFNTQRYAYNQDFQRWAFPVANGTYQVHLYFAELWDGCQGTGCRVARVYLEEELRESVDINALVGYRHGLRKTYTVTVTDGELYLGLTGTTQSPIISGIAIIPGSATPVTPAPTASITASPGLSICAGQSTSLTASGGDTYRWSTGATSATISVSAVGSYSVTVTNNGGSANTSVTVVSSPAPTASISGSTSVCSGQTTSLTATGGSAYRWNTGATTAIISVSAAGPYSVTATGQNGCSAVASTSVTTTNCPVSGTYVNCGGPQIIDAQGRTWLADDTDASPYRRTSTGISTGSIVAGGNQTDAPDVLFNTQRYAYNQDFQRWAFPVANGTYQVHLYFAELWDGCQGTGCRVARVYLEEELRESVDINALVGYRHGLRKTYTVTVTDGELYLGLTGTTQSPIISGIAIIPQ